MPSESPRVAVPIEPCPPAEVGAPCAGIGRELRCIFGDLSATPLPGRLADLCAALDADREKGVAGRRKL